MDDINYPSREMRNQFRKGEPEAVKEILRQTIVRAELSRDQLVLYQMPPLPNLISVNKSVPPRRLFLNPAQAALCEGSATAAFQRPRTGHASPVYYRET